MEFARNAGYVLTYGESMKLKNAESNAYGDLFRMHR